ncbi:hypothetical protein AB5I41_14225 [Sphingomonas sp. MMS24-JH45]
MARDDLARDQASQLLAEWDFGCSDPKRRQGGGHLFILTIGMYTTAASAATSMPRATMPRPWQPANTRATVSSAVVDSGGDGLEMHAIPLSLTFGAL